MHQLVNALFTPSDSTPVVVKMLADLLHVNITQTTLIRDLEAHPDYPSLASVSDILSNYGVSNLAIRVDPARLAEVPVPFIATVKGEKSEIDFYSVVRDVSGDRVSFFDSERNKWTDLPQKVFLQRFSGTILLVEAGRPDHTGEPDYEKKHKEETRKHALQWFVAMVLPFLLLVDCISAFIRLGAGAVYPVLFSMEILCGSIIGILLIWYDLDRYNPMLQQICGAGKKINCGAVLQSKASKIAGVSWTALGFTYFTGLLLLFLTVGIAAPRALFAASWLNVLALPYVLFSVYYQWRVAKQWCVLCLSVQALLVLQFAVAAAAGWHTLYTPAGVTPNLVLLVLSVFAVPFVAVTVLVPALQKAKEGKGDKGELQRIKHSPEIFDALLARQKAVTVPAEGLGITLGNPEARYKVIKVCNPYCGPCARAHPLMEEVLENNPDVQMQIIFMATSNDHRTPPARHLMAVAQVSENEQQIKQALDDWYLAKKKDYEAFASKYPVNGALQQQDDKLNTMHDWCRKMDIRVTPTFFLNGRQLPPVYNVADLKYFLTV